MSETVRGEPDRLEDYTWATTRTLAPLRVAIDDYSDAIRALNRSSSDLAVSITDESDWFGTVVGRMQRIDAAPGAFAWALRRLDRTRLRPVHGGGGVIEVDDVDLFHRLVDLRVADPLADDDVIWAEARRGPTASVEDLDGDGLVVKGDDDELRRIDTAAATRIAASTSTSLLASVPGLVARLAERAFDVVDSVSKSLAALVDDEPAVVVGPFRLSRQSFSGPAGADPPQSRPAPKDDGGGLFDKVVGGGKKLIGKAVDAGGDLLDSTVDAGQKLFGDALGGGEGRGLGLGLGGWELSPFLEGVNRFVRSVNAKAQAASALFPGVASWLGDAWDGITDLVGGLWDTTLGGLIESIKALIDDPGQWLSDVWENIRDLVGLNGGDAAAEAWLGIVKDFVAWDVWAENPWRAAGILLGNIALLFVGFGIGGIVVKIILRLIRKRRPTPSPAGDLDPDTVQKLSKDLTPAEIKDLSERLGPDTVKKLSDDGMSGIAIREAADDFDPSGTVKAPPSARPEWLERIRAGRKFDEERKSAYTYNQIYLKAEDGRRYIVDSYDPAKREIISRKLTQLGEVNEATAKAYLAEFDQKYAPNTKIDDVPSTPAELKNKVLQGEKILEVPVQKPPGVPKAVIDDANERNITIRDDKGHVYNP